MFRKKSQWMWRRPILVGSILLAATLVLTGCGTASSSAPALSSAQGQKPGNHEHLGVAGTVGSVTSGSFQLNIGGGSTKTVLTGPKTRYLEGKQKVSASALRTGQEVRVRGRLTAGNDIEARVVRIPAG